MELLVDCDGRLTGEVRELRSWGDAARSVAAGADVGRGQARFARTGESTKQVRAPGDPRRRLGFCGAPGLVHSGRTGREAYCTTDRRERIDADAVSLNDRKHQKSKNNREGQRQEDDDAGPESPRSVKG